MAFMLRLIASQMKTLPTPPKCSLEGRVFIITGANAGIGREVIHHLVAFNPAKIILAVRNLKAGEEAKQEVLSKFPQAKTKIEVWYLDQAQFKTVIAFAERCKTLERIDGVALNAGLRYEGLKFTDDGYEYMTEINVLSTIFLAFLLAPLLERTASSPIRASGPLPNPFTPRIIITGSETAEIAPHKNFNINAPLTGLNEEKRFDQSQRYFETKEADISPFEQLVLHSLIRTIIPLLPSLVVTDVNPGLVNSPFYKESPTAIRIFARVLGRTSEVGARNVTAALLTLDRSTEYFHNCKPTPSRTAWLNTSDGLKFGDNLWRETRDLIERLAPGTLAAAGVRV